MIVILICLALLATCNSASADIYRYTNDDGVECFTDSPVSKRAVRIMKEPATTRTKRSHRAPSIALPPAVAEKKGITAPESLQLATDADRVLPVSGRVSSPVGLRHDPIDGMIRDHKGVDIATPEGTPVRPVLPGVVIFSGWRSGYGNTVMVRHDDGTTTIYAHNSTNLKAEGEPVDRGSTIAFSGSTGRSTGPHLHFEAWKDGLNVTGLYVPGAGPSVATAHGGGDGIRRTVQADGTLVFSNLQ